MKTNQRKLAEKIGVTEAFISQFFRGKRKLGWEKSKLAAAVTKTDPILWKEGRFEELRKIIK